MAELSNNKVVLNTGEVLIDLTKDSVSEETLLEGTTAHDASGKQITGKVVTVPVDSELNAESENAIQNKAVVAGISNAVNGVKEYANSIISNPNLLYNWYFADPINQRGQTEYTNVGYAIDRWRLGGISSEKKYLVNERALIADGQGNTFVILETWLEKPTALVGKTVTFSVLAKGECADWIIQVWRTRDNETISVATTGNWSDGDFKTITFDFPADTFNTDIYRILMQTRYTLQPYAAKLELGSIQTLAHKDADGNWVLNDPPPNPTIESIKCQRFLQFKTSGGIDPVDLRPTMRITPTVVQQSDGRWMYNAEL